MIKAARSLAGSANMRSLLGAAAVALGLFTSSPALSQDSNTEYKLKAALIYKLPKFVRWPHGNSSDTPFGLCLVGENRFQGALRSLEGLAVNARRIELRQIDLDELESSRCEMLFISASLDDQLPELLERLSGKPIMSVSDMEGFAERGGGIEIARAENRLNFRINLESVRQGGLEVAAPLLDLATIVEG